MALVMLMVCALLGGCADKKEKEETSGKVASPEEMAEVKDVVDEDMTPVYGDAVADGVYEITVDSSSSMFRIVACTLRVQDGKMTAEMTMSGKGYRYLYMGSGEEAAEAAEDDYIRYAENAEGAHTYTVPVEALDQGIACAAFSDKKEKWYDRTLVFRADSLPAEALAGSGKSAAELGLEDGVYRVDVTLSGGSGKASVDSPAELVIKDGVCTATLVWSSKNYDYMVVDGQKILAQETDGNATFLIPVSVFDAPLPVAADTTAMSEPHEIEYTLRFDSESLTPEAEN